MRISRVKLHQAAVKRDHTASIMRNSWVELYHHAQQLD